MRRKALVNVGLQKAGRWLNKSVKKIIENNSWSWKERTGLTSQI